MGKILTTRDIKVDLTRPPQKLKQVTTKNIEVKYIDKDGPPEAPKGPIVTTHNVEEFQKKGKKKAFKLMTDAEKQVVIKERTAKMLATKARKKKEALAKGEEEQVTKEK